MAGLTNWDLGRYLDASAEEESYRRNGSYDLGNAAGDGGAAAVNPYAFAAKAGGGMAKTIADWLAGGQNRKDQSYGRGQLKGMMGKDVLNASKITGAKKLAYMMALRKMGNSANRRLGLNSGQAQQEMMWNFGNLEGNDMARLMEENDLEKSRRDQYIAGQFFGAGR